MSFADQVTVVGSTPGAIVAPATPAVTQVKSSAGQLNVMQVTNQDTNWVYVKVYNATSVTLGTTAATLNFGVPPGGGYTLPEPMAFTTGIAIAITGGIALADNTAITASKTSVNYGFT